MLIGASGTSGLARYCRVRAAFAESKSLGLTPCPLGKESPVFLAVLGTFLLVCLDTGAFVHSALLSSEACWPWVFAGVAKVSTMLISSILRGDRVLRRLAAAVQGFRCGVFPHRPHPGISRRFPSSGSESFDVKISRFTPVPGRDEGPRPGTGIVVRRSWSVWMPAPSAAWLSPGLA